MSVDAIGSATSSNTSPASVAPTGPSVDYDSFLQLLVAELKNQDPTKPTDATEYVSQLASFSTVEQQIQTNNKLDAMLAAMSLNQADGLVGMQLTSADGETKGRIDSVTITDTGLIANLADGTQVPVASGITISQPV